MISSLKKFIPLEWKINLILFKLSFKQKEDFSFDIPSNSSKRIFIFLAADYGNLGDVAITYAQHKFLGGISKDYLVTEIPISRTLEGITYVKKIIKNTDIVTTVGGGNMGDLYPSIEYFRRLVITNFKQNKIISFPQTIDFSSTSLGKKALAKTVRDYSSHPNLVLIAREQKTYNFFKENFKNNTILQTPDIVLSLNKSIPKYKREGVLICLRDDKEKKLTSMQEESLHNILIKHFGVIAKRDTHVGGSGLALKNRVTKLKTIWADFKRAKLVVTDRLHGMIFCYITGTPVIVFLNNNHKVKSSYEWIKSAPHVRLIEDFVEEDVKHAVEQLESIEAVLDTENLRKKYSEIIDIIEA